MKHLQFKVNSQTLKRLDSFKPAAGSVNYLTASFEFSEEWSGTTKTAKCRKDNAIYSAAINSSGVCLIPHEVLTQDETKRAFGEQEFYISVEGVDGTKTITTAEIKIELSLTGAGEEVNAGDPTPELYAQYIADVTAATKGNADTATAEAASAAASATEAAASAASLKNDYSNAFKGNASGSVVRLDDVSPVEHYPIVKVHGKNLIPFPYYNMSGVINGITYTVNNDGSVTAKGTATANAALYLTKGLSNIKGIVFLSGCPNGGSITASSGGGFSLRMNKFVNGVEVTGGADVGNGNKITLNGEEIRIYVVVLSGKTVDCTFYPMLSYGTAATEYTPYIDPSTIKVSRHGKNIISLETFTTTPSSTVATFTNGVLSIEGYIASHRVNAAGLVGETLTISCEASRSGEKGGGLAIEFRDIDNNKISGIFKQNELSPHFSFIVPDGTCNMVVFFYASGSANDTGTATYKNILLEIGGSVTAYEAYKGTTYTPNTDGTVEGLTSISPTMTLLTDYEGITIDCEYNRDINKAFAKLEALLNN